MKPVLTNVARIFMEVILSGQIFVIVHLLSFT